MSKSASPKSSAADPAIPYSRVTGLVRQLTHDVRNGLNNIDLQSAYLQELVSEPQAVEEIKRLRGMVTDTAKMLKEFSAHFWLPTPNFVTYGARAYIEDFQERVAKIVPEGSPKVRWKVALKDESISVDIEMLSRGLVEFFKNAFQFREEGQPVEVEVRVGEKRLLMELVEGKEAVASAPETWGQEPLNSSRRGGFGMGLFYARQVLAVHGGDAAAKFDPAAKRLMTRLSLPLAGS